MHGKKKEDTPFIRFLGWFFGGCGDIVCRHAWFLIITSLLLSGLGTLKIPLSKLSNKISDFTPSDAPSFAEYNAYKNFYEDGSVPNTIYAFITAKDGGNLYTLQRMKETVQVLDAISTRFKMRTDKGELAYDEFCKAFCVINEPVRTFYSGMRLRDEVETNDTESGVDLAYPDTTLMGMKMHMDPNLFGVKIAVERNGSIVVIPASDAPELNDGKQLPGNLRSFELIVFNFKSELSPSIEQDAIEEWEQSIVRYFHNDFKSNEIEVTIFADSFITSEVVRSGLKLLPFLVIGFVIMSIFSAATFSMSAIVLDQMHGDKLFLAVMACVCPFLACGAGLGGMLWCGVRFGTILCVTPFLVLAIGVDDAYLMVNAWQQITSTRRKRGLRASDAESELRLRMKEMLIETGPSVAITTITNVAAFAISAVNAAPEVQLFSMGNALCVLLAFIFQLTIYSSLMVITGRREMTREFEQLTSSPSCSGSIQEKKDSEIPEISSIEDVKWSKKHSSLLSKLKAKMIGRDGLLSRWLTGYCTLLTRPSAIIVVLIGLAAYLAIGITGTMRIKAELRPEKLFLSDSPFAKLFAERQEHIIPHYSVAWVYVHNPGNIWDDERRQLILDMVDDFESQHSSVGHYSTKFFLRDFEEFVKNNEELLNEELLGDEDFDQEGDSEARNRRSPPHYAQLRSFLSWPENSYWKGFIQFEDEAKLNGTEPRITRFFFTTAYQGQELKDWSNRVTLLKQWRRIAENYPQLNITVYQEDSKFLDIIDTMVSQSVQSALMTFASMFFVTLLFIPQPFVLCTATLTILSTSIGVMGIMSWCGVELDPIMMAGIVMSIGFAVDIPAHIAYHYHHTGVYMSDVVDRLTHTITRVGFPILQASISTMLCVSSLFFVSLHMSQVFGATMLLVVLIGTLHGLIVMPAIFGFSALFQRRNKITISPSTDSCESSVDSSSRTNSTTTIVVR